jgi:aminoglycoside 3-N-acetyltransferase
MVEKKDILLGLRLLGIREGDVLLVHSSLTAIGHVSGGAETVIEALLDATGESGTLVMSTLTGWSTPFDAASTPSAVGKISEVFRRRPDAIRSLHPVHSVAAVGKLAAYITAGHEHCETGCGKGTPYLKMRDLGGKVMLLGVDMDRNTIMHSMEEEMDASYLLTLDIPAPTYMDGFENKCFTLRKFPPGHRDFNRLTPLLREKDALIEGRIGEAEVKVMSISRLFDIGLEALSGDPMFFICSNPNCHSCHAARLVQDGRQADLSAYEASGCTDENCEICVVS